MIDAMEPLHPAPNVDAKIAETPATIAKPDPAAGPAFFCDDRDDVLWVKPGSKGMDRATQTLACHKLADAIVHRLGEKGIVRIRAFGPHAAWKAGVSTRIARGTLATSGVDLHWIEYFIDAEVDGVQKTGFGWTSVATKDAE